MNRSVATAVLLLSLKLIPAVAAQAALADNEQRQIRSRIEHEWKVLVTNLFIPPMPPVLNPFDGTDYPLNEFNPIRGMETISGSPYRHEIIIEGLQAAILKAPRGFVDGEYMRLVTNNIESHRDVDGEDILYNVTFGTLPWLPQSLPYVDPRVPRSPEYDQRLIEVLVLIFANQGDLVRLRGLLASCAPEYVGRRLTEWVCATNLGVQTIDVVIWAFEHVRNAQAKRNLRAILLRAFESVTRAEQSDAEVLRACATHWSKVKPKAVTNRKYLYVHDGVRYIVFRAGEPLAKSKPTQGDLILTRRE